MHNPIPADAFDDISSAALSRFFSTTVLRDLSTDRGGRLFRQLAAAAGLKSRISRHATYEHFYERAIESLIRNDRSEYVYKNALAQKLLLGRHSVRTSGLFFEFRAGQSKLDALFINGSSHAYEIKTSQDELRRLPSQIAAYQKRFTHVWVLTSEKHIAGIRALAPKEIGIAVLSKRYQISVVRKAIKRTMHLDAHAMLSSMRRNEFIAALDELGVRIPPTPNTLINSVATNLASNLKAAALHDAMLKQLKKRFATKQARVAMMLPKALTAVGLGLSISELQAVRLAQNLKEELGEL